MDRALHSAPGAAIQTRTVLGGPWLVLVAVAVGMMLEAMDATVVTVANPSISVEMDTKLIHLQWLANGYMFTQAVLLIAAGRFGDRFGHRRVFFIGMTGFIIASALVGAAGSIEEMIAFRVLQGASSAVLMPSALGILRAVFPPEKLQVAIGLFMSTFVIGGILGPIVGGVLVDFTSWRWVFLINLPLGAAALALGAFTIRRTPAVGQPEPLDVPGIMLLTASLLGLVLGVSQGPYLGWTSTFSMTCFAVAAVAGLLFVRRESTTGTPMLPISIFRTGSITAAVVITIIGLGLASASWFYLVLFMQNVQGYRPLTAGFALLPVPIAIVTGSAVGGLLNKRLGAQAPISAGLVLVAAGLVGLSRVSQVAAYHEIWPFLAASGLGVGFIAPAATEVIVSNTAKAMTGVASGVSQTAVILGNVLAIATVGTIISARVGYTLPGHLADGGVPESLRDQLADQVGEFAEGRVVLPPDLPANLGQAVIAAGHSAFVDGLRLSILVGGLAVAATFALVPLIRRATVAAADTTVAEPAAVGGARAQEAETDG